MPYTIERTREALLDPAAFYERNVVRACSTMLAHGTTTLETKTGYALHKPGESALLDFIAAHRDDPAFRVSSPRFSARTRLPPEFTREDASSTT